MLYGGTGIPPGFGAVGEQGDLGALAGGRESRDSAVRAGSHRDSPVSQRLSFENDVLSRSPRDATGRHRPYLPKGRAWELY